MKVHYVKTIVEKIREARDEAERRGKKIEYVELDNCEWEEAQKLFGEFPGNILYYRIAGIEARKAP